MSTLRIQQLAKSELDYLIAESEEKEVSENNSVETIYVKEKLGVL